MPIVNIILQCACRKNSDAFADNIMKINQKALYFFGGYMKLISLRVILQIL